jgi:hypothetical protein
LVFAGYLKIKDDMKPGRYVLRAYTKWMQNSPSDYMFSKEIIVVTPASLRKEGLGIADKPAASEKSSAGIDKSASISSNASAINKPPFDLQFFPESGRYFVGEPAKIAFKAIGTDGLSVEVEGSLFKSDGTLVGTIATRHKGMGVINLMEADKDGYYVVMKDKSGVESRFDLPFPEKEGVAIALTRAGEKISVKPKLINLHTGNYFLKLSDGEENYYSCEITSASAPLFFDISNMPSGINSAKIMGGNGEIFAERLFYIHERNTPEIVINTNKGNGGIILSNIINNDPNNGPYTPKESIVLIIKL